MRRPRHGRPGRAVPARRVPGGRRLEQARDRVDSDQYKTVDDPALQAVIMTSMLKRVDNSVQAYIDEFVDGGVAGGKDVIATCQADGVALATEWLLHRRHQVADRRLPAEDHRPRHQGPAAS